MSSICKFLRSGVIQLHTNILGQIFAKGMTGAGVCGGRGGKKDGTGDSDESKVCPICNNSECKFCSPPYYDCRKYGHNLPNNTFEYCNFDPIPNVPADVFRYTAGEQLGPRGNACKDGCYPNPEYFSYQHMSYYDLHLVLKNNRLPNPKTNRKC